MARTQRGPFGPRLAHYKGCPRLAAATKVGKTKQAGWKGVPFPLGVDRRPLRTFDLLGCHSLFRFVRFGSRTQPLHVR